MARRVGLSISDITPSVRGMREANDAVLVRMSKEEKERLRQAAEDAGLTLRAYALHKLFDLDVSDLPSGIPGRRPRPQEELPLTG